MDNDKSSNQDKPTNKGSPEWLKSGWLLGGFALLTIFLLALTYEGTREQIAIQEKRLLEERLKQLLVAGTYDNDPAADVLETESEAQSSGKPKRYTIYRVRNQGDPVAALIKTTAPDGYNGSIQLLVGVRMDGSLQGVRTIFHKETPGLGDEIDMRKSDWILGFSGRSLTNTAIDQWAVKKDGGTFDAFTGATITPRAVVREVRDTLLYFQNHQAELFQ